jgi:hypothetical protein
MAPALFAGDRVHTVLAALQPTFPPGNETYALNGRLKAPSCANCAHLTFALKLLFIPYSRKL